MLILTACGDKVLSNVISIMYRILTLFQIIVPILAIIGLVITMTKFVMDPENKKIKNSIKNCIMALLFFFFLPVIVNLIMGMLDNTFTVATCWNEARNNASNNSGWNYHNTDNDNTLESGQGSKVVNKK